ncbi:dolichyl-phosphate beta-glucosyltransferase-like [Macrosteles quadrilineatus]|uniref:dolichyl-phosphate beta-glucosyltransferase-like n=2 Tax=Macrosteles quadrilineatus TaxID=74068 RepID=UPI0023E31433|nr:dolichyl-phosphate beta-glucosyltransferase-like [Macrosteles quadrilineatus]
MEYIYFLLVYCIAFIAVLFAALCVVLMKTTTPHPVVKRTEKEKSFLNTKEGLRILFPSLDEPFSVLLSVIVPAYDEEKRLPPMLDECFEFLETRKKTLPRFTYEVIVVSDGSRDKTVEVAQEYTRKYGANQCRVLNLQTNRGKGGAVRLGMQSARGAMLLFADADGATKFSDLVKLEDSLKSLVKGDYLTEAERISNTLAVVCGSRAHLEKDAIASRSLIRTILMHGFHLLVWTLAVRSVHDTQCGFKLLTREAARVLFSNLHVERWAFDVELLYLAEELSIPVSEVCVNWTEIDGSKIVPVWSWLQMGQDLFLIWLRYTIGAWKIHRHK